MKILLSPAKLMNVEFNEKILRNSTPKFIDKSAFIQSHLSKKTPEELQEMMKISDKLADENWQRNQDWNENPIAKESTQAIYAFQGEVYRGLDATTLNEKELNYLQEHLWMLSGLYGVLKPSDRIMLYRLEMGSKFPFDKYKNLYDFWKESLTDYFNSQLKSNDFILNLASNEYAKVLDKKKVKAPFVEVDFKEMKNESLKTIMVYAKNARGRMARFCAEKNVQTIDEAKAFSEDNYLLNEELSSEHHLVFTR